MDKFDKLALAAVLAIAAAAVIGFLAADPPAEAIVCRGKLPPEGGDVVYATCERVPL